MIGRQIQPDSRLSRDAASATRFPIAHAAALVSSLPAELLARIVQGLSPAETARLIRELGCHVATDEPGQPEIRRLLLSMVADADAQGAADDIPPSAPTWGDSTANVAVAPLLEGMSIDQLLTAIEGEYPQTAAAILTQLSARSCARVLARLDQGQMRAIVLRMAAIREIDGDVLGDVRRGLERRAARRIRHSA